MRALSRILAAAVVLALGTTLALPSAASVLAEPSVTLTSSAVVVEPGQTVTLTTTIAPPASGEAVAIVDTAGATVASGTTNAAGVLALPFSPQATVTLNARWQALDSAPVTITVATGTSPSLSVRTGAARLFDAFEVSGRVTPAVPGATVKVQLLLRGDIVASKKAVTTTAGRFTSAFTIASPGRYVARAVLTPDGAPQVTADSSPRRTPLPTLAEGADGVYVSLLERRLLALRYRLTGVNGSFDFRTADAVMAFRKVQGLPRIQTVTPAVWRALAAPKLFVPRVRTPGFHIEIDQTRQVLATVRDGEVQDIIHVSTGKPSTPTRDGSFRITAKLAGFSPKRLWYPSFFDGERAIHGWTDVPAYAASHGCVRIPYWVTLWMFDLDPIGTQIIVYH